MQKKKRTNAKILKKLNMEKRTRKEIEKNGICNAVANYDIELCNIKFTRSMRLKIRSTRLCGEFSPIAELRRA